MAFIGPPPHRIGRAFRSHTVQQGKVASAVKKSLFALLCAAVLYGLLGSAPPPARNVPILMYHTSSETRPDSEYPELYVKPSQFELQLKTLKEQGYTFCTFEDMQDFGDIPKPVLITFDDGYEANYREIFPILKAHDAKITLFLFAWSSGLAPEMIREMSDSGLVKFEAHTLSHPNLRSVSAERLDRELRVSKTYIEELTGKPVVALSYPYGEFNGRVKEYTEKYYQYGVRRDGGVHNTARDRYEVRRIRVGRSTGIKAFVSSLEG